MKSSSPWRRPQDYERSIEVVISHVCRHWRDVAVGKSCLWTHIRFREVLDIDRAAVYLRRSQDDPIYIVLDTPQYSEHIPGVTLSRKEMPDIMDLIMPHAWRFKSLHLQFRDELCKDVVCGYASAPDASPAPMLETLQLYYAEDWTRPQRPYVVPSDTVLFRGETPRLRDVSIVGANMPWREARCFIRNITSFELKLHADHIRPNYEFWRLYIQDSPRLHKLALHYSGPRFKDEWSGPPVEIPSLRELHLVDMGCEYLLRFFAHTKVPGVTTLRLELDGEDYTAFVARLARAEEPDFPLLERLEIVSLQCELSALRTLVLACARLKHLQVDFTKTPAQFAAWLAQPLPGAVNALPLAGLESWKVTGVSGYEAARLMRARRIAGSPHPKRWELYAKTRWEVVEALGESVEEVVYFDAPTTDGFWPDRRKDDEEYSDDECSDGGQSLMSSGSDRVYSDVMTDEEVANLWAGAPQLPPAGPQAHESTKD